TTMSTLIEKVKELIGQQAEIQRQWNKQMQNTMNKYFNKLEQVGIMSDITDSNNNYMNKKEINAGLSDATIHTNSEPIIAKNKAQKYLSINYSTLKQLPTVQGFANPLAASIKTFGSYIELTEFAYKNIKASAKYHHNDLPLQASEGGYIAIGKQPTYNKFNDIFK
ncbi:7207_t:CDS:2, partial [Dentiscutata heterogama]